MAFDNLKKAMTTYILALPIFSSKFIVESNASYFGIGVVLTQSGKLVLFFSKTLFEKH